MIYLDNPNISFKDIDAVQKALLGNDISTVGDKRGEFEKAVAAYLGGDVHCISTNSGSAAIFTALKVLGTGHGDEVIIPATTFVATKHAVTMTGARPVVVDIDPNTWNIDPAEIEKAITIKTKAILPVHLYGNPCDMEEIMQIANDKGLEVIEDACQSLGATYDGYQTGTIGPIGCFSFNRNKIITSGGGGMIVTNSNVLAERARQFVNQGRDSNGNVVGHGFNFGMVNQNAALGLSQMGRLPEFLEKKHEFYNSYCLHLEALIDRGIVEMQKFYQNDYSSNFRWTNPTKPSFWFTAIKINHNKQIPQIQAELKARGIPTRRIFEPLTNLPNARELYEKGLCLPSSTLNAVEDIEYVAKTLLEVLG
jgi:perosamine synthetase